MLHRLFEALDREVADIDQRNRADGLPGIPRFYIRVLGQAALLEANIGIPLIATIDVDAYLSCNWLVRERFCALLQAEGRTFDELSPEIWMPPDTRYRLLFAGVFCEGAIAEPEYVLVSKALKAPVKNRAIIQAYLAKGPAQLFLELAQRYAIDLESFVR